MDYKDYSELYKDTGEAFVEIILQEKDTQQILRKIEMWAGDYKVFEDLGMEMVDRGVYHKWVDKNDITSVFEEKYSL